jgi:hypothetical protein
MDLFSHPEMIMVTPCNPGSTDSLGWHVHGRGAGTSPEDIGKHSVRSMQYCLNAPLEQTENVL